MPGAGQSLGGATARSSRADTSLAGPRQSTPDPEEVRRRRLAFLEKQNQNK